MKRRRWSFSPISFLSADTNRSFRNPSYRLGLKWICKEWKRKKVKLIDNKMKLIKILFFGTLLKWSLSCWWNIFVRQNSERTLRWTTSWRHLRKLPQPLPDIHSRQNVCFSACERCEKKTKKIESFFRKEGKLRHNCLHYFSRLISTPLGSFSWDDLLASFFFTSLAFSVSDRLPSHLLP